MGTEIWKITHSKGFKVSLLIGLVLTVFGFIDNYGSVEAFHRNLGDHVVQLGGDAYHPGFGSVDSFIYSWMGINQGRLYDYVYYAILPLLAGMPCVLLAGEERGGFGQQEAARKGKRRRLFDKAVAGMLTGGFVVSFPIALNALVLLNFLPVLTPSVTDSASSVYEETAASLLFYRNPMLFMFLDLSVIFSWGCVSAMMALAVGAFIRNRYLAAVAPFLLFILIENIVEFGGVSTAIDFSPIALFHLGGYVRSSGYVIAAEIGVIGVLSAVVFFRKGMVSEL